MERTRASHHEFGARHEEIETSGDRSFGLVFATVFAFLAAYLFWRGSLCWPASTGISGVFLIAALLRASVLAPLNRLWTKLGLLLGAIVAPIVMGLIYFAVMTPMGAIARLFGKDFLRLRRDPRTSTYWLTRQDRSPEPERLRDQF